MLKTIKILLSALLLCATTQATEIRNGSFESSVAPDPVGFKVVLGGNATWIPDWEIIGHSVDLVGPYWTASDGGRSIDLNGIETGGLRQVLSTMIGQWYEVSFDLAGNPEGLPATKVLEVRAANQSQRYAFDTSAITRSAMGWIGQTFEFQALDTATVLEFESLVSGHYGPALDRVSISAVPESTGTGPLLASAMMFVCVLAGTRRKETVLEARS